MLKPKNSFQAVVTELVRGLRSGEVVLPGEPHPRQATVVERARFHQSSRVCLDAAPVSYANVRWSDRAPSPVAR